MMFNKELLWMWIRLASPQKNHHEIFLSFVLKVFVDKCLTNSVRNCLWPTLVSYYWLNNKKNWFPHSCSFVGYAKSSYVIDSIDSVFSNQTNEEGTHANKLMFFK